jgi:hypothetical protein
VSSEQTPAKVSSDRCGHLGEIRAIKAMGGRKARFSQQELERAAQPVAQLGPLDVGSLPQISKEVFSLSKS